MSNYYNQKELFAFDDGYDAGVDGKKISDNPYCDKTENEQYQAWREGYWEFKYE